MKLKSWLQKQQMSQTAFAKLIKTDQAHVSNLVTGKVLPSMVTLEAVFKATGGEVSFHDWVKSRPRALVLGKKEKR